MNIRKTFAAVAAAGLLAAGLACGDEPAAAPPTATPKAWPTRDPGTVRETRTALATRNAVKLTRVPTATPAQARPASTPTRRLYADPESPEDCELVVELYTAAYNAGLTNEEIANEFEVTLDYLTWFIHGCYGQ